MNNISLFMQDVMALSSPEFKKAWELQSEIARMRELITKKETELKEMTDALKGKADEIFAVANLRPYRVVSTSWVKENMPETYDKLVSVSNTNAGKILNATHTREQVNDYLKEQSPEMFDEMANISITDLEREIGKVKTRNLEGTAYKTELRVTTNTQIVIKHPEKYNSLPSGTEELSDGTDE